MQIYKTPLREFKFLIEDFLNLKESEKLKKLDLETSDLMLICLLYTSDAADE